MDSQSNQFSPSDFSALTLLPQKIPGQVKRKLGYPILITPLVNALPLEDGTFASQFFSPSGGANENDYVLFRWENVGKRGFDFKRNEPGDPTAIDVEVVTEDEANRVAAEIRQITASGLQEELAQKQADLNAKEEEIERRIYEQVQEKLTSVEQREFKLEEKMYKANVDAELVQKAKEQNKQLLEEISPYRRAIPDISTIEVALPIKQIPVPQDLASRWRTALVNNGLVLPETLATSYLVALFSAFYSGSLVLLNGPVGVGKTSIVKETAKILNGKNKIIPVRLAWLDPSDLLGYFDPIKEVFRPSPFLNALQNAKAQSDNLSLICLDELNLARIENYGADLLSALEYSSPCLKAGKSQQGLLLYSESIEKDLWQEAKFLNEKADASDTDTQRLQQIRNLLRNYPANFHIAPNTVILGTLNSDETTYDLSPKIIDRSYVVTYPAANLNLQPTSSSPSLTQTLHISTSTLADSIKESLAQSSKMELPFSEQPRLSVASENVDSGWQSVVHWNNLLAGLCTPLGHRTKRDFRIMYAVCNVLGLTHQDCLGYFLFTKLLPRISFLKSPDTQSRFSQLLITIKQDFNQLGVALEDYDPGDVLYQLETQLNSNSRQYVRYWVRT